HPLSIGGYIIDSPGIKELGIIDFERNDLSHYFPEMRERLHDCKFSDCIHINEPGCAVKAAVESGEIAESRYTSYCRMLEEVEDTN
ncbi:MAG: ribosome small subunit-dependent GTPase A, partial [Bacteroidetes bacterium]|nr:ribosome small subunit-dependent GTPase A [Bacteroidota bacterium]